MNSLYHFGDSYATVKYYDDNKHFCHHIANELNLEYCFDAFGGLSNELIFDRILNRLNDFKEGDVIFVNFSFFVRGCYYDKKSKDIKSTNTLYNEIYNNKIYNTKLYNREILNDGVVDLIKYYLNNTIDYNVRIFKLIDSVFKFLNENGVLIFYIFIEEFEWSDFLLKNGTNISFTNGFYKWLQKNNFHNEEDIHYTVGIQPMLSDVILRKTNYLSKDSSKKIKIDIEDIDYSKILKPIKLL